MNVHLQKVISKEDWDNYVIKVRIRGVEVFHPNHAIDYTAVDHWRYGDAIPEKQICRHFGCGQVLTRQEQLFGNLCVIHNVMGVPMVNELSTKNLILSR